MHQRNQSSDVKLSQKVWLRTTGTVRYGGLILIPFGPFDLEHPLARGGTCDVWRGVHRAQAIPVAVKVGHSKRARTERFARAFREEVRAVVQLHHPGIVKVFDYGIITPQAAEMAQHRLIAGSPFMVMELAEANLLSLCGRLTWDGLFVCLMSILDGLAHAHARGVIHRDIKPGNVLLVGSPAQIRLADFGLAQPIDRDELPLARHGLLGTPSYMAPEQFEQRWRDYWPWTDLYALGCTAYALACGRPPFGHTSQLQEMKDAQLFQTPPAFPDDLDVAPGFEAWVMRLLQKSPALRYRRAADAAWALRQIHEAHSTRQSAKQGYKHSPRSSQDVPMGLFRNGTYVLHFVDQKIPSVASSSPSASEGSSSSSPSPVSGSLSGVAAQVDLPSPERSEGSFHPELHVDSLDSDGFPSDTGESTWVDSFRFGVVPDAEQVESGATGMLQPVTDSVPPFPMSWEDASTPLEDSRLDAVGLGLFGLREVSMVGREKERDVLRMCLQRVYDTKRAMAVVISGPGGCGKSRLADWLCTRAHEVGAATYVKATHQQIWSPTSGLGPMVGRYLRCPGLPRGAVEVRLKHSLEAMRADWGGASEDAIVLTEMIAPADTEAQDNDGEGSSITFSQGTERYAAVGRFLERLCGRRVAIAWLDDVQWGLDTLEFAHAFLERQQEVASPVLLLLTVQPEAISEREDEAALLDGLIERDDVHYLSLGGLSPQELPLFLQRLLPLAPALSTEIEERTAGHPSFAIHLLEDWIERDILVYGDGGFCIRKGAKVDFPDSLHQMWGERIERLLRRHHPNARVALELAAVLGHDVNALEWEVVCQEAGIGIDKAWVDALLEAHLANCEHGDPALGWSFVHNMCREALERGAQEKGRLQEHHRICAMVLRQRTKELLPLMTPPTTPGKRPELAERIGRHLLLSGQENEALSPILHGLWARIDAGEYRLAWRIFTDWEALLQSLSLPETHPFWGEALLIRCRHARGEGRYEEALQWSSQAVALARTHQWERVLVRGLMQLGYHNWFHANGTNEGWRYLEEASKRAMALGDRWSVARCHRYMGDYLCYRGELELAALHFQDAFDGFQSIHDRAGMGHARYGLANVERQAGRNTIAMGLLDNAQLFFAHSGSRRGIADCLNAKGDLFRHQGDLDQAEQCYRKSMEICRALGDGNLALSELNLALVLSARAAFAQARPILERASAAFLRGGRLIFAGAAALCLLPCAASAQDWELWDRASQQAQALLLQTGAKDVDSAHTAQLAGNLALKAGQVARARQAYQFALSQWEALGRKQEIDELTKALDGLSA